VTDGSSGKFQQIFETNKNGWILTSILGASVSVMLTHHQNWEGQSGYIFEVDYLSETTGQKELHLKKCSMISSKSQNCIIVASEVIYLFRAYNNNNFN